MTLELNTRSASIKTAYELNANTNAFTDAEKTKLTGIETAATADQSAAEILAALLTVDGDGSLLDADLLDGNQATAFATAAQGALADTSLQNAAAFATAAQGATADTALQNIVEDTTPQLGGNLDVQARSITTSTLNGNLTLTPNGTGNAVLGTMTFNADQVIGVGNDNHVLTYDNATGLISLEAAAGGGAFSADVNTQITPSTAIVLDQATGDEVALNLSFTVNKLTSGNYTGLKLYATETSAPGTDDRLIDVGVGVTSKAYFDNNGQLRLDPAGGFGIATGVAFGDGDTVIYESADDNLVVKVGTKGWQFSQTEFFTSSVASGPGFQLISSTATAPNVHSNHNDMDTGIGWAGADKLSLIAGGVEGIRLTENVGVLQTIQANVGLTADAGSIQGGTPLTSSYNVVATVATTGDAVTLPTAVAGHKVTIINRGANACDVFPASGDDCGAGANVAVSLAAAANITYFAIDATTWITIT